MLDPGTIISLLAAGAIAKVEGLGGEIVADAYVGLKRVVTDVYGFTVGALLEKQPKDEATLKTAEDDLADDATGDPEVIEKAQVLEKALAAISHEDWTKAGVIIEGITADGNFEAGEITAGKRGVVIRFIRVGKDFRVGKISG